jgi:S-formylglutathione hydrolase
MTAPLTTLSEYRCFGGVQAFYSHFSEEVGLPMRFGVFLPHQAQQGPVGAVVYLAGLTCNEETFAIKAGAQRRAAELGLALITPDTSPRGAGLQGEADHWDFGVGAGFYLDATEPPWSGHWRMESWLMQELIPLIENSLPVDDARLGVFGHSMGGHGALTLALRHPGRFKSLSALAPICAVLHARHHARGALRVMQRQPFAKQRIQLPRQPQHGVEGAARTGLVAAPAPAPCLR